MSDEDLRREVERLREEVSGLERRLERLETDSSADRSLSAAATEDEESAISRPSADREPIDDNAIDDAGGEVATPVETAPDESNPASERESAETSATGGRDWELTVGIRLFGLAGALALVVGVVFFVRVAIETGLLGPLGRVAVGTIGGIALFAVGRYAAARQGYVRWGRIAAGAGLAIAYFSLYAAYGFEDYREAIGTPLWAVLIALTVLVAATAIVSVRDRAPLVVSEAFLLGYVTASLSIDAATLVVTPAYVLLLSAGLVTIGTIRPWSRPIVSSTFATYGVLALWLDDVGPPAAAIAAVTAVAFAIYLLAGHVLRGSDRGTARGRRYRAQLLLLTAVNAVAAALFLEIAVRDVTSSAADGFGLIGIAIALVGAYAVFDRQPGRRDEAAAAASVVLLVGGLQMTLDPFATTAVALAIVVGAIALSKSFPSPSPSEHAGFRVGAHLVAAALVLKLLAIDANELAAFDAADPLATFTGRPVAFALAIGVFYALAWWFSVRGPESPISIAGDRAPLPPANGSYAAAATGLAVIVLALELSGVGISVAWALYGFVLLGIGLLTDYRGVRFLGIAVLGFATVKVFLFDTSDLDTAARTISFVVLGAVLLAASYGYARSKGDFDVGLQLGAREKE